MKRIYGIFFLSGAAGLVYQVVWSRLLHEIFGVTVHAVTTVLATFLAGLALGAVLLGRVSDRSRNPLRFYGWLEVAIGLSAVLGAGTIRLLDPLHVWAANRFESDSLALIAVRVGLASLVVLPPTFLMGGTLPAITRFFVTRIRKLGRELSLLYALNTAGAVVGTLASGFVLIRWFGMHLTLGGAVLLNLLVGAAALWLARSTEAAGPEDEPRRRTAVSRGERGPRGLLAIMALSGFVSLGLEVLWTRVLMLSVGTTTYSFVTMLSCFLAGIALGSYIARRVMDRLRDPRRTFGWIQVGIAASVLAALPLINAGLTQRWLAGWGSQWLVSIALRFGVSFLIMLVPTILIGMTFPLAARLWTRELKGLGGRLGQVYGANTLGNIAGAVVTGFLLLPALGLQKGIALLTVLNLVAAAWGLLPRTSGVARSAGLLRGATVLGSLAAGIALVVLWQPRPFAMWGEEEGDSVLYYREGIVGTVKVVRKARDPRQVWMAVDAIKIGESHGGVDQKQQALAHFPFLLRPDDPPRRVLSIGLGTGILIAEVVRHPEVSAADCVEISPAVIEASEVFSEFNGDVSRHPAVRIIQDDGVNFLRRTTSRYDAVISDAKSRTTHAANAVFFSRDYYRLCREHLEVGGTMIQWIPLNVPPRELRVILRTFAGVFPHVYVWTAPRHSCFLVGQDRPLELDPAGIDRLLAQDAAAHLRRYGMVRARDFIDALTADGPALDSWLAQERTVNSFEHPVLEFYSPRAYAVPPMRRADENLLGLIGSRGVELASVRFRSPEEPAATRGTRSLGRLAEGLRQLDRPGSFEQGLQIIRAAVESTPDSRVVRHAADAAYRHALKLRAEVPAAIAGQARILELSGRPDQALASYRHAARLEPGNSITLAGMARVLAGHPNPAVRDPEEALRLALRAVELSGGSGIQELKTLEQISAVAGRRRLEVP